MQGDVSSWILIYELNFFNQDFEKIFDVRPFPTKRKSSEDFMIGEKGNFVGHKAKGKYDHLDLSMGSKYICPLECRLQKEQGTQTLFFDLRQVVTKGQ